jgi:hypothetical protein
MSIGGRSISTSCVTPGDFSGWGRPANRCKEQQCHLGRYLDEQVFRYNNRATKDNPLTDSDRFALAITQVSGKRLTYAELTGKEAPANSSGVRMRRQGRGKRAS